MRVLFRRTWITKVLEIKTYFYMSDASKSAARENEEEFRRVKADFLRVGGRTEGEKYRGANSQEAPLQFVADHHNDQRICRNSK